MYSSCLQFPVNLAVKNFITQLNKKITCELTSQYPAQLSFYDSFDWRLSHTQISCEFNRSKKGTFLTLKEGVSNQIIATEKFDRVPTFFSQYAKTPLQKILSNLLEMRALLLLTTVQVKIYHLNVLNQDQKTIARLEIKAYENLTTELNLQAIRGYDKATQRINSLLLNHFSCTVTQGSVLATALKQEKRKINDYSSKFTLKLNANMPANEAMNQVYQTLLTTIKINESGTMQAIDSEFLHDFRVAIRRTRSGLSQLKSVLPTNITDHYRQYFSWLGRMTSVARDTDVYVLNIDDYKQSLPKSMREDLTPLKYFLLDKQTQAQKSLVQTLKSKQYQLTLKTWEHYLSQPVVNSQQTVKELADTRIWKAYRRVLKQGLTIKPCSPAQTLHDLRKNCKKLRYLIEFFQSLYPIKPIKTVIKLLKRLQEVLGDFQDYEVQESQLRQFSEEMMQQQVSSSTFLAMGVLIQTLDSKRTQAREDFSDCFTQFKTPSHQLIFKSLFVPPTEMKK